MSGDAPPPKKARKEIYGSEEYFPDIPKIPYKPDAAANDVLCFKYYNPTEVVLGKPMSEWLRFSVCFWHSFRGVGSDPFGAGTIERPWDDGSETLENAERRLWAIFEFLSKLGVSYWTFHDRDIAPEGETFEQTNQNLHVMVTLAEQLMKETGVKLLWNTCNLFSNPRYMNGALTNPDAHVAAYAAAQIKKSLEVANRLGAENFVFWGGREGYQSLLNTNVHMELSNMANIFKMAVAHKRKIGFIGQLLIESKPKESAAHKKKIGFTGQLLIEPKPKEPTRHQYDYDAMTVIGFLKQFDLDKDFKLNIEPNHTTMAGHQYHHDIQMASIFGMLGSVDSNTGSPDLGWDTDQFPMDISNATQTMKVILDQGGLAPGGLNFDAKVRRESTDIEDLFIAHIGAMDTFARGLRNAAKIREDGYLSQMLSDRYASYSSGLGLKIAKGEATLEECEEFIHENGEPEKTSGQQEKYESILNRYL